MGCSTPSKDLLVLSLQMVRKIHNGAAFQIFTLLWLLNFPCLEANIWIHLAMVFFFPSLSLSLYLATMLWDCILHVAPSIFILALIAILTPLIASNNFYQVFFHWYSRKKLKSWYFIQITFKKRSNIDLWLIMACTNGKTYVDRIDLYGAIQNSYEMQ